MMLTDTELDHRDEVARLDGNYLARELIAEIKRLRTLLAEACEAGRDLGHIGLDLTRRSPSISTEDMIQERHDRIAAIRREIDAAKGAL